MNAVSAPWSRSGWREPDTTTWSSTDNTWRDWSSLLHMSWSTCRGAGKKGWRGKERRKQERLDDGGRGATFFFFLFLCEVMQVEVMFVCFVIEVLVAVFSRYRAPLPLAALSVPSTARAAAVNLQVPVIFFFAFRFSFYHVKNCTLWKCVNESGSRHVHRQHTECTCSLRVCVRHIFAAFLHGPRFLTETSGQPSRLLRFWETALLLQKQDQKWTGLSLIRLNSTWLWGQVWSHTLQSPWISVFGFLFIIFFYIIHDICTYQLSLKNCTNWQIS